MTILRHSNSRGVPAKNGVPAKCEVPALAMFDPKQSTFARMNRLLDAERQLCVRFGYSSLCLWLILAVLVLPRLVAQERGGASPPVSPSQPRQTEGLAPSALENKGIAVELTDTDGKPCTTGYIRTYPNPRPKDWEGDQPRNFDLEEGKCFVPLSNFDKQKSFKILLYADGFAPYELRWADTAKEPLPTKLTFKMPERAAAPIGGRVVDTNGKPVADAEVEFNVSLAGRANNPQPPIMNYMQWIKTDAEGYWSYKVLPTEQLDQNFDMTITHDAYPKLRIHEGQTFKDYAIQDADGKFAKTIVMPSGQILKGRIVDEQGNPVVGAIVHSNAARPDSDRSISRHGKTTSNANGEFLFENCSPRGDLRTVDIGICHNDFAPDVVRLEEITSEMMPLNIVLKKGKKLILKAVDTEGKPVEGMKISSNFWKNHWGQAVGTRQLFVDADEFGSIKTGADGRFVWENAPDNRFDLEIGHKDYQNVKIEYETLKYGDEENVYVFKPVFEVTGIVTDAETGETIPRFSVSEWFTFKGSSSLTREFGQQSGKEGKFTRKVGQRFGEFDNYHLRVEADGYEGLQSEDLLVINEPRTLESGTISLEFKLKKATGRFVTHLTGTVLQPDGKPAANAEIGIATGGNWLQINGTTLPSHVQNRSRTDNTGKFSISRNVMQIGDQDYKLIFLHDAGTITMDREEFEKRDAPITLQAWSRIEGTVRAGSKPVPNGWVNWSLGSMQDNYSSMSESGKPVINVSNYNGERADANGRFSFRIFPGKGSIGRMATWNNASARSIDMPTNFEVKPGETLKIDIGGGGYIVKGRVVIPLNDTPKPVDWRFGYVQARPAANAVYLAYPTMSEEAKALQEKIGAALAREFQTERYLTEAKVKEINDRWKESPEAKALIEENREAYEEISRRVELMKDIENELNESRARSYSRQITCIMDDKGNFQLDDLTPGAWTLEITLNFPTVPLQWHDFADVWRTKVDITIPDFPADKKIEVLEIPPIPLGYDKSDRKGPSAH